MSANIANLKVMRTFGWNPTDLELQVVHLFVISKFTGSPSFAFINLFKNTIPRFRTHVYNINKKGYIFHSLAPIPLQQ